MFCGKILIKGEIKVITGLRIGGSTTGLKIGGVDLNVITDPKGKPYIPGSSLKGKMRSLMETYFNMNNFSYSPASCTLGSGTTCTCSTNVQDISNRLSSLCQDIRTQNGGSTNFSLVATQNSACISVQLASGRGLCMDTQGNVKETPTYSACLSTGSNAGTCP